MRRTGADAEGRTDSGLGPRGAAGSTGGSRHKDGPAHLLHAVRRFFLLAMNAVAASHRARREMDDGRAASGPKGRKAADSGAPR